MELIRCENMETWDEFVSKSSEYNIFCTTPLLEAVGEDYDLLMVVDGGDVRLGAVVLKRDGSVLSSPRFYQSQGILFSGSCLEMPIHSRVKWRLETTEFLLHEMEKRYNRISFCLNYGVSDIRSFQWYHYHAPELGQFQIGLWYTAILDMKVVPSFDEYFSGIRTLRQRDYQRSLKEGMICEESDDVEILDRLHHLTFERQRIVRSKEEINMLVSITKAAIKDGFGRMLVCRTSEGKAVAANLFLYDSRCCYYMYGGNDPEFRKIGCGTYLMLKNIQYFKERGLERVDFVGINSPNRGDFKTSFNSKPTPYYVVHWERP
jgi:GNAT superfamily N-acetyltransferase